MLKMPPICAVTGRPADTAIIVRVGHLDLILPATTAIRADHSRFLGTLRTARRLRPSVDDDVVTLHHAAGEFVEQLIMSNEPGTLYVGGLYPLAPSNRQSPATADAGPTQLAA
ncbi:hypothetical protein GCM10011575_27190 [Microlunatus endophyticus]|uniref:Uncharacterized protein n=1 Tax=Microlunatus endophyticus TaxID=1716077 RepID=A0A917W4H1_9ACTN|nr:hypothetical protein [Microlunatus endophyticus]GGL67253.1 hypothetical protein GCM10011575_27190 [Microlunatus endophyticus]